MRINEKKLAAILALPGAKRYSHFVKVVADQNCVWGLYHHGWALMATDSGEEVFPVWPAEEYARLAATGDWQSYAPKRISMDSFLHELLPSLRESKTLLGVFPASQDSATTPTLEQVEDDVREELSRIE